MTHLRKFSLKDNDEISNDEMKFVTAGDTRNVTFYDCVVVGNEVPNAGELCIVSYDNDSATLKYGVCKAIYGVEGGNGQFNKKVTAYCDTDAIKK